MRDEDYGAALTLAEGDDGIWSPPMAASACEQPDWRSLYEQAHTRAEKERARADAAQARAEELRSGRKRGQQRGAAGHGRTQRPGLEEAHRRAQPARRCAGVFLLREALRGERRAFLDRHRDRSQGPHTQDRPSPVAPELRLRIVAPGSVGAPGGAAVPQHALRDQLLGTLPVRALCLLPAPAPRCRVAVRPGAGGLARDAGQHSEALRGAVRAGGRGDPRAPERGGAAPCRRDHLARPGASRGGPVEPGLAVDLGQQRRGLLPHRSEPQCRGGAQAVRRGRALYGHRLRPLQRLQEAGAPSRGTGDPCMVLEICCGRDYVAERQHPYVRREKPPNLRNIFF